MKSIEYTTVDGTICEHGDCQNEPSFIEVIDDSDEAYYEGKLLCEEHAKRKNLMTWGRNHKMYIDDDGEARLEAEQRAFYFHDIKLNGERITKKV